MKHGKSHYMLLLVGCLVVVAATLVSCGSGDGKNGGANGGELSTASEYAMTQVELALARSEKPYLDINLAEKELWLKLKGAVVWSCPITILQSDSDAMKAFVHKFQSGENRLVRPVVEKYLFSAKDKTPDSVLKIVGEVVNVAPEKLQREIPSRFQLVWEDGLILEVHTDVAGKPKTSFKNTMVSLSQTLQKPFGEVTLVVQMTPEEAMTLYRVSSPGFPTMIHPPK
jgi:hypothetical protein